MKRGTLKHLNLGRAIQHGSFQVQAEYHIPERTTLNTITRACRRAGITEFSPLVAFSVDTPHTPAQIALLRQRHQAWEAWQEACRF